ncbi:MAG: hypothetical protein JWR74_1904 [Polaromonas sp.]|nr:hypothetical protein [Polaromonas sp.]
MNATQPHSRKTDLTVTHVLAELLERLEHSKVPVGAEQYRSVVQYLVSELGEVEPGTALGALLDSHPAAAELYENVNYQFAGLCRSALEASLASERQAKEVLDRAMRRAMNRPNTPFKEDPTHGKS